ncbi:MULTISPECIES: hypothetical protein [Rhizobium]|uniref:hypothetical protein n=1 Tax=Rhizobium TaxID=379 RepID=UPI000164AEC5|nr:hypothetical protein [Rhizobium leguminosarum]MBY2942890.1 hypothetical protein [Rhizobium leguminosarum]MBY2963439.1 hypothetical protein [Rhizobium leguminosarum]MBY2987917.1 hypothetical protein [Rhizobium leguminosarum]MBY3003024.1 hypothetical protein [Rhizobium leguminosarum]MBY3021789.1 hypothetical protein [Rhizobium leguminosarum]
MSLKRFTVAESRGEKSFRKLNGNDAELDSHIVIVILNNGVRCIFVAILLRSEPARYDKSIGFRRLAVALRLKASTALSW